MTARPPRIVLGTTVAGAPLALPLDIATESVAIIARKGAGKTYTGRVLAEDLIDRTCRWSSSTRSTCGGACASPPRAAPAAATS
jgi:hypothetical protein